MIPEEALPLDHSASPPSRSFRGPVTASKRLTAPINGPRTVEHLTGSLRSLEASLSDETLRQLDAIWPGPGGEAPLAYAW